MKTTIIAAFGALFLLASAAMLPTAACADEHGQKAKYTPKISLAQARKAALKRMPGKVLDEELEKEDGVWIYSFDIRPRGEKGNLIKEVHVDPNTGKILGIETEHSGDAEHDGDGD